MIFYFVLFLYILGGVGVEPRGDQLLTGRPKGGCMNVGECSEDTLTHDFKSHFLNEVIVSTYIVLQVSTRTAFLAPRLTGAKCTKYRKYTTYELWKFDI